MDQIELPNFAQELASLMECEKCGTALRLKDVVLCGVRREADGVSYFHFASVCSHCGEKLSAMNVLARPGRGFRGDRDHPLVRAGARSS